MLAASLVVCFFWCLRCRRLYGFLVGYVAVHSRHPQLNGTLIGFVGPWKASPRKAYFVSGSSVSLWTYTPTVVVSGQRVVLSYGLVVMVRYVTLSW